MRWIAWPCLALIMMAPAPSAAQEAAELDEGVAVETPFVVGVEPGVWELGLQVGYLNLNHRLFGATAIVVDVEDPSTAIFGDMEVSGESSFHPQLKINRTFGRHFAFESALGFTVGDYQQSVVEGSLELWIDPSDPGNELTDLERERGSYFMWMYEGSGVWYPLGEGRVQPFVTGGVGFQQYNIDSKYLGGASSSVAFSYGGGLRVIGDDLYSFRLEVRNYHTSIQFDVAQEFIEVPNLTADGLVRFPVSRLVNRSELSEEEYDRILAELELDQVGLQPARVPVRYAEQFAKEAFSNLWISIGFVAAF
jgi:hypothetical protein